MEILLVTLPDGNKFICKPILLHVCNHFNVSYHAARLHFKKKDTEFVCSHSLIRIKKIEFDLALNTGQL